MSVVRPVVPAAEQDAVAGAGCIATGIIESPRSRTIVSCRVLGRAIRSLNIFYSRNAAG